MGRPAVECSLDADHVVIHARGMDRALGRWATAAAVVCLAVVMTYMVAGAAAWACSPLGVITEMQARQDFSLALALPAEDVPVEDTGISVSAEIGPFAYPYPPTSAWWESLLGADDYGARGHKTEIIAGSGWSAQAAEQRLVSAGWATEVTDDHGDLRLTATSPDVPGVPFRVLAVTNRQSFVRVDLLHAAPPSLHSALLGGAVLGGTMGVLAVRSRLCAASSAGNNREVSVLVAVSTAVGALAVGAFALFSALYTIPVWASPFGAAAVAPWAPLMSIGVRQVIVLGLALLVLAWLLTGFSRHRPRSRHSVSRVSTRVRGPAV